MTKKAEKKTKRPATSSDKRLHARVPLRARVDFELFSKDTFLFEYASNLSRGGIFLQGGDELKPGRRLHLRVNLPGAGSFHAIGQITWIQNGSGANILSGVGVQFKHMNDQSKKVLEQFLTEFQQN